MTVRTELSDEQGSDLPGAGACPPGHRMVVGVDGSAGSRAALLWALVAAARRGADVQVVTAFPLNFYWTDTYLLDAGRVDAIRADTEKRAGALVAEVRGDLALRGVPGSAGTAVDVLVTAGAAAEHLVRQAEGADLLVVGSRGRGAVRSAVLGSVAQHCVTHAPCPVVVVHPASRVGSAPARIVVGVDGSDPSQDALGAAIAEAQFLDGAVEATAAYQLGHHWSDVYAGLAPAGEDLREELRASTERSVDDVLSAAGTGQRGALPVVRVVVAEGPAGEVLVRQAQGADLLVIGSRGHSRLLGMLLGSVALYCAGHAPCPVLVVHPRPAGRSAAAAAER